MNFRFDSFMGCVSLGSSQTEISHKVLCVAICKKMLIIIRRTICQNTLRMDGNNTKEVEVKTHRKIEVEKIRQTKQ